MQDGKRIRDSKSRQAISATHSDSEGFGIQGGEHILIRSVVTHCEAETSLRVLFQQLSREHSLVSPDWTDFDDSFSPYRPSSVVVSSEASQPANSRSRRP